MTTVKNSKAGFTLVELLVVITIIGILAGMAVPGIGAAMKYAKKAQAGAMISNLKVALTAYEADYGAWPTAIFSSETPVSSYTTPLYLMLIGNVSTTNSPNPRGTVYMEFNKKDLTIGDGAPFAGNNANNAAGFMDPWRSPYWIRVSLSYDNQVSGLPSKSGGSDEVINASVAIWSVGPQPGTPIRTSNGGTNPKDYITSW